jgi:PEP-CTERM motif-containing protein
MSAYRITDLILTTFLLASTSLLATPETCPSWGAPNIHYPLLGEFIQTCGSGVYDIPIVATVPEGTSAANLESWLGNISLDGINGVPLDGSAVLFPDFNVLEPSVIGLEWEVEPEGEVGGFVFAAIDGPIVWSSLFGPGAEAEVGAAGQQILSGSELIPIGLGNHSLALGIVRTCPEGQECDVTLDPPFTFHLEGPTAASPSVPEPSTFALIGIGLGIVGLFRYRRNN